MKILLIAGHGAGDPGATARFGSITYKEADETRKMAGLLVPRLSKVGVETDVYNMDYNAYADYKAGSLKSRAKFQQYDYVLELHLNAKKLSAGDGKTKGVECYVTTWEKGTSVEEAICRNIAALGFTNRGVKPYNFGVISAAKRQGVSSALLEICFIDDYDDVSLYAKSREKVADAIVSGICEGFGVKVPTAEVKLQQWGTAFGNIQRLQWVYDGPGTVSAAAKSVKWTGRSPDAICNGELFDRKTFEPSSGCPGNVTDTLGFAFVDGRQPVLSYANNRNAKDWIGSYPMLLRDGKVAFDKIPAGLGGKCARTALAISDTHFAFFYVKEADGCTLEEFAKAILARGFHTAINLDGGGSTACITPGVAYDQGRKVRGKIAMWIRGGSGNKLIK